MPREVAVSELEQHNSAESLWIAVNEQVYDMTNFVEEHPGGPEIIYEHAGRDASGAYNEVHAPSLIKKSLEPEECIGPLLKSSIPENWGSSATDQGPQQQLQQQQQQPPQGGGGGSSGGSGGGGGGGGGNGNGGYEKPPLDNILNLYDLEDVARRTWSAKAWAFIHGASNDNLTRDANSRIFQHIWLRPAIMRNVTTVPVSTKTRLFGAHLESPIYIAPTGAPKMAGPEAELALTQGAAAKGSLLVISTPSSFPHDEILAVTPEQAFFQLYVNKERHKSEEAVRAVEATGKVKALFVTVDLPVSSKREDDERVKFDSGTTARTTSLGTSGALSAKKGDKKGAGLTRQNSSFIDGSLNWDDVAWLRSFTKLPIVVKGIQRWEDARLAVQHGVQGIVLSNHGGRAADTSAPTIVTLLELHRNCPEVFDSLEVLVDGGFRRGSDVLKAICLGASAVGIGRPFLYSLSYGQEGVEHAFDILKDEIQTAMQLCGITDLMRDASPQYVNTGEIDALVRQGGHPYARERSRLKANL